MKILRISTILLQSIFIVLFIKLKTLYSTYFFSNILNKFSCIMCFFKIAIKISQCNLRKVNNLFAVSGIFVTICPWLDLFCNYFLADPKARLELNSLPSYIKEIYVGICQKFFPSNKVYGTEKARPLSAMGFNIFRYYLKMDNDFKCKLPE